MREILKDKQLQKLFYLAVALATILVVLEGCTPKNIEMTPKQTKTEITKKTKTEYKDIAFGFNPFGLILFAR